MTDLVVQQAGVFNLAPRAMLLNAVEMANVLKDVIQKQKLSVKIGPNEYVKIEAWSTLGVMLGILPRERDVRELPNGDYEASVDLIRHSDGVVVGGASALCGADEKRWSSAERYARRSMAITRATGKAYRLCFAWIMTLAGYQGTPYEEMPEELHHEDAHPKNSSGGGFDYENTAHKKWLDDELRKRGIHEDDWNVVAVALQGKTGDHFEKVLNMALNLS